MNSCTVSSPAGLLRLSEEKGYLIGLEFINNSTKEVTTSPTSSLLMASVSQLQAYFAGRLVHFDIPLKPRGTAFQMKVWNALLEISYGKSWSYAQLAIFLGDVKCVRAAASANGKNPLPIFIPCHRVIGSDGRLVGYGGGLWRKELLLKTENHPLFRYRQGILDL